MSALIGPGRLILVVGPSGAGKDTLLTAARDLCADDPAIVFARRVVTRPSTAAEDHDSIGPAEFDAAVARGGFAFWWEAHGNKYGIPSEINDLIRSGHAVVCNGSRATAPQLRAQYGNLVVVLVSAPTEILQSRLSSRQRNSDGDLGDRLSRSGMFAGFEADHVVVNDGTIEDGAAKLAAVLRSTTGGVQARRV